MHLALCHRSDQKECHVSLYTHDSIRYSYQAYFIFIGIKGPEYAPFLQCMCIAVFTQIIATHQIVTDFE